MPSLLRHRQSAMPAHTFGQEHSGLDRRSPSDAKPKSNASPPGTDGLQLQALARILVAEAGRAVSGLSVLER